MLPLHEAASAALGRLRRERPKECRHVKFLHQDMLDYLLEDSDFDVLYLSCLTWSDELMSAIAGRLAETLAAGSRVITLRQFPRDAFSVAELVAQGRFAMSWGIAVAYVYEVGSPA